MTDARRRRREVQRGEKMERTLCRRFRTFSLPTLFTQVAHEQLPNSFESLTLLLKESSAVTLGDSFSPGSILYQHLQGCGGPCFQHVGQAFTCHLDGFCQVFIMGYSVAAGATGRLLFGYDSFGNVCGKKNSPVEGAPLSGQDMTLKK